MVIATADPDAVLPFDHAASVDYLRVPGDGGRVDSAALCAALSSEYGVRSVVCEGGPQPERGADRGGRRRRAVPVASAAAGRRGRAVAGRRRADRTASATPAWCRWRRPTTTCFCATSFEPPCVCCSSCLRWRRRGRLRGRRRRRPRHRAPAHGRQGAREEPARPVRDGRRDPGRGLRAGNRVDTGTGRYKPSARPFLDRAAAVWPRYVRATRGRPDSRSRR